MNQQEAILTSAAPINVPSTHHGRPSLLPRASLPPRPARRRKPTEGHRVSRQTEHPIPATPRAKTSRQGRPAESLRTRELLATYMPIVRQIVGGFQRKLPRNVLREDLLAAGMSGLWDAIRRHADDEDNQGFEWYVRVRVRGAILDELRAQDWLPRRARAAASATDGPGRVAPLVVRIEDISEREQNRWLVACDSTSCEAAIDAKNTSDTLARAVQKLPERERHIVSAHYFQGTKFKDLGAELGVSEPRISQLHSRAMTMLRDLMNSAA
jgi:RNA polymerase sigma factor for flagellar operon FliA